MLVHTKKIFLCFILCLFGYFYPQKSYTQNYQVTHSSSLEGLLDDKLQTIFETQYNKVQVVDSQMVILTTTQNKKTMAYYIAETKKWQTHPIFFDDIIPQKNGLLLVRNNVDCNNSPLTDKDNCTGILIGIINNKAQTVLKTQHNDILIDDKNQLIIKSNLIAVRENDKWGFVNTQGKQIVPCEYNTVLPATEGYAAIMKNDMWGFVDSTGKIIATPQYKSVLPFKNGLAVVLTADNRQVFIDTQAREALEFTQYDVVTPFSEGFSVVQKQGKKGVINKSGKQIIPLDYQAIAPFKNGTAVVQQNNKWGVIGTQAQIIIPIEYTKINVYNLPQIQVFVAEKSSSQKQLFNAYGKTIGTPNTNYTDIKVYANHIVEFQQNGIVEFVNLKNNKTLISQNQQFTRLIDFGETIALVEKQNDTYLLNLETGKLSEQFYNNARVFSEGYALVMKNAQYAFIDSVGNQTPFVNYQKVNDVYNGLAVIEQNATAGIMTPQGKVLISPQYTAVVPQNTNCILVKNNNRYGFVNAQNQIIMPIAQVSAPSYQKGFFITKSEKLYGYLNNETNQIVIPTQYYAARPFKNNRAAVMNHLNQWAFIDPTGNKISDFEYTYVKDFEGNATIVNKNGKTNGNQATGGKWGIINNQNKHITPLEYTNIETIDNNTFRVEKQLLTNNITTTYMGILDSTGVVRVPIQYEYTEPFVNGYSRIYKNNLYGFCNYQAQEICPPKYTETQNFVGKHAIVRTNELWGAIDHTGKQIIEPNYSDIITMPNQTINFFCRKQANWFIISPQGKIILQTDQWNGTKFFSQTHTVFFKGKYQGLIDNKTGKEVLLPIYTAITVPNQQGKATVTEANGNIFFINSKGKKLK